MLKPALRHALSKPLVERQARVRRYAKLIEWSGLFVAQVWAHNLCLSVRTNSAKDDKVEITFDPVSHDPKESEFWGNQCVVLSSDLVSGMAMQIKRGDIVIDLEKFYFHGVDENQAGAAFIQEAAKRIANHLNVFRLCLSRPVGVVR